MRRYLSAVFRGSRRRLRQELDVEIETHGLTTAMFALVDHALLRSCRCPTPTD